MSSSANRVMSPVLEKKRRRFGRHEPTIWTGTGTVRLLDDKVWKESMPSLLEQVVMDMVRAGEYNTARKKKGKGLGLDISKQVSAYRTRKYGFPDCYIAHFGG